MNKVFGSMKQGFRVNETRFVWLVGGVVPERRDATSVLPERAITSGSMHRLRACKTREIRAVLGAISKFLSRGFTSKARGN